MKPMVEKTVLAIQLIAAEPDATMLRAGAVVGAAICQFHVAFANPVSEVAPTFACVRLKLNCAEFAAVITAVTLKAPLEAVVWLITTVWPTEKLFIAVMVATLPVSETAVIVEKLLPGFPAPKSSHFCCSAESL